MLIARKGSRTELAVILFNRIEQLRAQKKPELEGKQRLIILDPDLKNAIRAVDNEIKHVQGELAKLGRKTCRESDQQMIPAVLYARVSSKDQDQEGYSIPAQQKLLREYAQKNGFQVVREFVDVETAKKDPGESNSVKWCSSYAKTCIAAR